MFLSLQLLFSRVASYVPVCNFAALKLEMLGLVPWWGPSLFYDRQLTFDIPSGESWQRDDAEEEEPAAKARGYISKSGCQSRYTG
jgi:hypothetical protein